MKTFATVLCLILLLSCQNGPTVQAQEITTDSLPTPTFLPEGQTIADRFLPPADFQRSTVPKGSFAGFLRTLPLEKHGAPVHYFDGKIKNRKDVHVAVIDLEVGDRDLQQCADAIMRLRAEYLYQNKKYDQIAFNFTNGFRADYAKWRAGQRIKVEGNEVSWTDAGRPDDSYEHFRKYLDMVFAYAGTLSLERELAPVSIDSIQIGDVFIRGGSPGHAIIVVDLAENEDSGERLFLLAQSYMPAQDIHLLSNPRNKRLSPWYTNRFNGRLVTPEWMFEQEQLRRFKP
ncbi:MAG TPA: DUF4846 domain-containing protein [Saprospiraceae bacterium]|nr:DUF4846 domain-containing protein [Saprospiraceae bacterium]